MKTTDEPGAFETNHYAVWSTKSRSMQPRSGQPLRLLAQQPSGWISRDSTYRDAINWMGGRAADEIRRGP